MSKSIFIYQPSGIKIELPNLLGKKYDINGITLYIDECITPPTENVSPKLSLSCLQEKLRRTVYQKSSSPEVHELPVVEQPKSSSALSVSSSSSPEVYQNQHIMAAGLPVGSNDVSAMYCETTSSSIEISSQDQSDVSVVNHVRRSLHSSCSNSNQLLGKRCRKTKNDKRKNCKTSSNLTSMFENLDTIPLVSEYTV